MALGSSSDSVHLPRVQVFPLAAAASFVSCSGGTTRERVDVIVSSVKLVHGEK